jgi:hypothetical protein
VDSGFDTLAGELIAEQERLAADRGTLDSHLEEIAARIFPDYSGVFTSGGTLPTAGSKRNQEIYDSTGANSLNKFAAVNESLLVPSNERWHGLAPGSSEIKKDRKSRLWLDNATDVLFKHRYNYKANFVPQMQQNFMALGAFGSGTLFIDELEQERGFRYKHIHLGELYFAENHQGIVDKFIRRFPLTARQARQKFGEDKLPPEIKKALEKTPEQIFYFLHCVKPREDLDPVRRDYKGMKFASYYVSVTGKKLMSEGGYNTFPAIVSRHRQAPGEVYGRGPAMDVLPALKTLNEMSKVLLTQGHRAVNPIYLIHDDGIVDTFSALPGAMVSGGMSAEGRPLVGTLPVGRIDVGKDLMDDQRAVIKDSFYVTLFQILTERPQATATEVLELVREKGILLNPTVGRQEVELLGPMIDRELDLAMRQGLLPPMPPALLEARGEYTVRYTNPMSRMRKAEELAGTLRTINTAAEIANITQDPSVMDVFQMPVIIRDFGEGQAMPERHFASPEVIAERRKSRAEQAQTQEDIQAAPAAASMIKAMAPGARKAGK